MRKTAYDYMDWTRIEAVVYCEENQTRQVLGPRRVDGHVLISCYFPDCSGVQVKILDKPCMLPMEEQDEHGFYAVLLEQTKIPAYTFVVSYGETTKEVYDPYAFPCQITKSEEKKMLLGTLYEGYEKLGAHPMSVDHVKGVYFAVWAPNAMRVSVVGDFNQWDGRIHQMNRLQTTGVYELFIPEVEVGSIYKFEIKAKNEEIFLKSDPYAMQAQLRPDTACIVADIKEYSWSDDAFVAQREKLQSVTQPMFIYELHLGSFMRKEEGKAFSYREIAPRVIDYVKEMGYTHVELMPIMEYPYDPSWGYQVTGYYAPTSRYGACTDFMYFVDVLHQNNIGVILDWVPAHFPRDSHSLARFDGTCLYEHEDPRLGAHPHWGTLIFNYRSPFVMDFLIGNALYWVKYYHIDGIRMDAVASMLYLDYGREQGEWIPNKYGGHENLDAIHFLKTLNTILKETYPDVLLMAEESTAWPKVTGAIKEDGLGFDYKWNMGWMNDMLQFMKLDPLYRGAHQGKLTFSMDYHYSEKFVLSLSHDEVVHGKGTLLNKMPGTLQQKFANLRFLYGYMLMHPGKKLLFMGQEYGQTKEWDFDGALSFEEVKQEEHQQMLLYSKALMALYKAAPALYQFDYEKKGFSWLRKDDFKNGVVTFVRNTDKVSETLLIVANYSGIAYDTLMVGVPYTGKYKEIFNSDKGIFGGADFINPRIKASKLHTCDGSKYAITVKIAPLSISVFSYRMETVNRKKTTTKGKGTTKKKTSKKQISS